MKFTTLLFIVVSLSAGCMRSFAHGDLHLEIEAISRQLAAEPTAERYLKRGELQREHGEFDLALADYRKAEELEPGLDVVLFCQGQALFDAGRFAPARAALDQFLVRKPSFWQGWLTRARVLAALKEYKRSAGDYSRSIELSADPRPEQFLERAQVLVKAGKTDDAIQGLDEGMQRLGAIPTLQSYAVEIEAKAKRYDAALKRIDRLVANAPRKESWQILRAEVLTQVGRRSEARQAWQDALTSIAALPERLRNLPATRELETKARAGLAAK
jgi:predicted Zn-dependent protease